MNKTAIKNFAIWARNKLIADISYRAGLMGITEKGIADPLPQSTNDTQFFDIGTAQPYAIHGDEIRQRRKLVEVIRQKEADSDYKTAYQYIIEEVAYTWFNRLIAVRFMEVNDYLPSHIRVLSSESGKLEPDLVTNPFDAELEFKKDEESALMQYRQNNQVDEAFRLLFRLQCNALHEFLPGLFETTADYTELLLNLSIIDQEGVVYHLVHDMPEDDFNVEKGGQIEIIGWLYQYYNTEPKNIANAKKRRITKEEVPAVTQLFTPDWIVRYMVENSLGRLWTEGHSDTAADLKRNWKYYLEEAGQEPEVQVELAEIRKEYAQLSPEDLTFIDPCMGSGHILVYAFDVLMQIYERAGFSQRDAVQSILKYNLYGLDIDDRAAQLAYFAVMMKARQYDGRIFKRGIQPHVYAIQESNNVNRNHLKYLGGGLSELERNAARIQLDGLLDALTDAKEYGSILNIDSCNWALLRQYVSGIDMPDQATLDSYGVEETVICLSHIIAIGEMMARRYWIVATNPPYQSASSLSVRINEFLKANYPESKSDLYAVFIEKCVQMTRAYGYQALITQHSWMFISSYEALRKKLMQMDTINMIHLGARAFDEIAGEKVQTTTFVRRCTNISKYIATYCRIIDPTTEHDKEMLYLAGKNRYHAKQINFDKVPGTPVAYWVSDRFCDNYKHSNIANYAEVITGMTIGDNNQYLRIWYELQYNNLAIGKSSMQEVNYSDSYWIPYSKGGTRRNWYGNYDYVVNWTRRQYFNRAKTTLQHLYLKEAITWPFITPKLFSARLLPKGFLWDVAGSPCFFRNDNDLYYTLGFMCSKVADYILSVVNPTINVQAIDISQLPLIIDEQKSLTILECVTACVNDSKADWNSFETSWDFGSHPLVLGLDNSKSIDDFDSTLRNTICARLQDVYMLWDEECTKRFLRLKENEERVNALFIDIYGLKNELTFEVEDKNVTVRKADVQRDIKSLISYAVGCMFGRYSVDAEGLIFAGGNWDVWFDGYTGTVTSLKEQSGTWRDLDDKKTSWSKINSKYYFLKGTDKNAFESFPVDYDNVIPITDEEYFDDDIVARFCDWVKYVYGVDTLEENLDFIAKALGNKGQTSRDVIRNYFLNDFYKDHCQTYSVTGSGKRPIYWLFDSGKQNGFKALIYLHRYTPDTIGNLRVDYLHRMQHVYESEIDRMQDMITHSTNSREVAAATKRKEKLQKQLKECRDYDEKIGHLALSRIDLDLDDGVKVNYRKIQTAQDGKFYEVLADSKNIMAKDELWQEYLTEWKH